MWMVITTDTRAAEQETPVSADWSELGGTYNRLAETRLKPNTSAQQFTPHSSAALASDWTSNELQIANKVTSSLSLT